jgi:hypothetical protein
MVMVHHFWHWRHRLLFSRHGIVQETTVSITRTGVFLPHQFKRLDRNGGQCRKIAADSDAAA